MADFYSGLAGYQLEPAERPDGSLGVLSFLGRIHALRHHPFARCPPVAPAWLPYLRVEDVKAATKQAEEAGARVVVPPNPAVRNGRLALIVDPHGRSARLSRADAVGDRMRRAKRGQIWRNALAACACAAATVSGRLRGWWQRFDQHRLQLRRVIRQRICI